MEIKGPAGAVDERAVRRKYEALTRSLIEKGRTITAMESCTAGLLASLITDTEGSSAVFKGSFVTYSNASKIRMGVSDSIIEHCGVYSAACAAAMAEAARTAFGADLAVGVTGTFGNADPNNAGSSPGEVFFAITDAGGTQCCHCAVPEQPSRFAYKLYMADVIADCLLDTIMAEKDNTFFGQK